MKKILTGLALTATLATSAMANAGAKHSIVAGLGVGFQNFHMHNKTEFYRAGAFDFAQNYAVSDGKFGGTAFLGYHAKMGMFLGGIEVDTTTPATYKNTQTSNQNTSTALSIRASFAFGASVLLGANINDNAFAALRVGGEWREHSIKPNFGVGYITTGGDKVKVKGFAFAPGVVVGFNLNDCWQLSGDYRVRLGRSKTATLTGVDNLANATRMDWKLKPTTHTFMLKLNYRFGL